MQRDGPLHRLPLLTKGLQQQLIDFIFQLRRRKQRRSRSRRYAGAAEARLGFLPLAATCSASLHPRGGPPADGRRPMELAIGNMVRRVLFIIREEF